MSNFQATHLQRLFDETDVVPAVNQIEVHPYLAQPSMLQFNADHGIATEAWSPIAQGKVLDDGTIVNIANNIDKTPAQVVLRWHVQQGNIVFPKSGSPERMQENFELFDFELSANDMELISKLNRDERMGPDPDVMDWIPEG